MKFKKNVPASQLKIAKEGDVFVLAGHSTSCTASAFKAGFSFTTNMGWLTFKPSLPPVAVTVITITGMRGES